MSLLFYKRPDYVEKRTGPMGTSDYQDYLKKSRAVIPKELGFEYVVANRAMPVSQKHSGKNDKKANRPKPCSLQDFSGYLQYVAHDVENLQFYLWLQDYTKRFSAASKAEQALSPPWDGELMTLQTGTDLRAKNPVEKTMNQGSHYDVNFDSHKALSNPSSEAQSIDMGGFVNNPAKLVEQANAQTGLKWQSCQWQRTQ